MKRKRSNHHQQQNTNSRFNIGTPESSQRDLKNVIPEAETPTGQFQKQEMRNIRERVIVKKAIKKMQSIIPKNKSPENIYQEWESQKHSQISKNEKEILTPQKFKTFFPFLTIIFIIQGIFSIIHIWLTSVALVFKLKEFQLIYTIISIITMINILFQGILLAKHSSLQNYSYSSKLMILNRPFLLLFASALMILHESISITILEIIMSLIALVIGYILSKDITNEFQIIKIYAQKNKVMKQLRIIQLFCLLIVVAHIFGLILYSSSYVTPEDDISWIRKANLQHKSWITRYIYSIYWAITTIVTVGYGDITPQNIYEVLIVMIIQICGTSFFGYMINVIGITVDNINKKNEQYDNYQETIAKLSDHYQLSKELSQKMKHDVRIKYDQLKSTPLNKNQETEFLEYVDSTIKKDFILETNIKIIKKSIFFLTYFTVQFQNQIALKLIRIIYKKDERIQNFDEIKKQRSMIIINHGKVNIFIKKNHNNIHREKKVKTICPKEGQHTLNVFGYSSLILNRNIKLFAVAGEIISGYILKNADLLECIQKSMKDYENLHEIKQKMNLVDFKESIEAPSVQSSEFHYVPNIFILLAKETTKLNQLRRKCNRRQTKYSLQVLQSLRAEFKKNKFTVFVDHNTYHEIQSLKSGQKPKKHKKENDNQFQSLLSIEQESLYPTHNILTPENMNLSSISKNNINLDQVKIFQYFMKSNNINHVAANYQKSCLTHSFRKRILSNRIKNSSKK